MMELPEVITISRQANKELAGKVISQVFMPTNPHRFAFFYGEPESYKPLLTGKRILLVEGSEMFVDIKMDEDTTLSIGDGVRITYGDSQTQIPEKYQLLLAFADNTFLALTITMYGVIFAFKGEIDNIYHQQSFQKVSPLSDAFDENYFLSLFETEKKKLSAKALLASEQRIPGLGNGVLQDILFRAKINPKRKVFTLSAEEKKNLFQVVKSTLKEMTEAGGRSTETDFYGKKGGYESSLSSKTYKDPCPVCEGFIMKEAYMGGSVYYCLYCQPYLK